MCRQAPWHQAIENVLTCATLTARKSALTAHLSGDAFEAKQFPNIEPHDAPHSGGCRRYFLLVLTADSRGGAQNPWRIASANFANVSRRVIEEVLSGVQTLRGFSTCYRHGRIHARDRNQAVQIFNTGDYERTFGGLSKESAISYAVQQFFLNGGTEAWIVRVAEGAQAASVILKSGVALSDPGVLDVTARSEGTWGDNLRVVVDYDTSNPDSLFNLTITEMVDQQGTIVPGHIEKHRNLSMSSSSPTYVQDVIDAASELVRVVRVVGAPEIRPKESGTVSLVPIDPAALAPLQTGTLNVRIVIPGLPDDAVPPLSLWATAADGPKTLEDLRTKIEAAFKSSTRPVRTKRA